MKKYYQSFYNLLLSVLFLALPLSVSAQIRLQENFDYPEGDLYGQGGWVKYASNPEDPIQVTGEILTYDGYPGGVSGKSVKLGNTKSGQDLQIRFDPNDDGVKEGSVYYSALIKVTELPNNAVYVMSLLPRSKTSVIADGKSTTEYGRLFIGKSVEEGKYTIGVDRISQKPVMAEGSFELESTQLIVVKYAINAADGQDVVSLYVNPADFQNEPQTADAVVKTSGSEIKSNGLQGFELRQGTNSTNTAPVMYVGSLRISDSYAGLFSTSDVPVEKKPEISYSKAATMFGPVLAGTEYMQEMTVKGKNLKGGITVSTDSEEITLSATTLSAEEAESAEGAQLMVTLKAHDNSANQAKVTFSTDEGEDVVATFTWQAVPVVAISTLKELISQDSEEGNTYRYTGEAVISYVDNASGSPVYYLQDETAGLMVKDSYEVLSETYQKGDKLTGLVGMLASSWSMVSFEPVVVTLGEKVSSGNDIEPVMVTMTEIKAQPKEYVNRLVKVQNVAITTTAETFTETMVQPTISDGTESGKLRLFKQTSLIGTTVPTEAVDLIGLSTSVSALLIAPRGVEDIIQLEQGDPAMTITPEKLEMAAGKVNETSVVGTLHVSAQFLPADATIELTGKNAALFSTSVSTIGKGTSETDVVVSYTPNAIGKHSAYLWIDCPSAPELSQSFLLSAYAIDEQNPPTITVEPEVVPAFRAKAGEKQEQTIAITTAHLPDYAYLKVKEAGAFRISSSMLLKDGVAQVRVSFEPSSAGTYETAIEVSTLGMETFEIPLYGEAVEAGSTDPDKEGDALPLDDSDPVTLLVENFDNVVKNTPVQLESWKNLAMEGTRAWWGYDFPETDEFFGEKVAKVTSYDSKVEEGTETPAQMMLVTPALDFKNATSKMFTFRVRGDYLRDGQEELLELCYIDILDGEMYVAPVGGFSMPCMQDESGEWKEYHIDLAGQDLADTFFMGFRYTGSRGRTAAATYYIDDVTYGRTDIPVIRPSSGELTFDAVAGQDAISADVEVDTENLAEPVKLTLGGANKSKFYLTLTELPVEGGRFAVKFHADEAAIYNAYVKMASRGAADKYITLTVNNYTQTSIDAIDAAPAGIKVYNLEGKLVYSGKNITPAQAVEGLNQGVYILQKQTEGSINTYKVRLD